MAVKESYPLDQVFSELEETTTMFSRMCQVSIADNEVSVSK